MPRQRVAEVGRQDVEVQRVHRAVVIEIAMAERCTGCAEILRHGREVQSVDRTVVVGIAGQDEEAGGKVLRVRVAGQILHAPGWHLGSVIAIRKQRRECEDRSLRRWRV